MSHNDSFIPGKRLKYLDFALQIGPGNGQEYPVDVLFSPEGNGRREIFHFPFNEQTLENRILALENALLRSGGTRRKILTKEEATVQDFGQLLFDALVAGEVRRLYDASRVAAREQGKGLRFRLQILPPELATLPWEFMYDRGAKEYLCLLPNTPLVRDLELQQPIKPLTVVPPLRVLGMVVSPQGVAPLDVDREKQRIESAVRGLKERHLLELTWLKGQTWRDLQRTMRQGDWHVFHFIGHGGFDAGTDQGLIAFANEAGRVHYMSAIELGRLLAGGTLRLVLLNSCEGARNSGRDIFSSTTANLLSRGIPAVVAMQYEITDAAAIEFSRSFYEALADNMPVDTAVTEARKAVSFAVPNTLEWGIPVLYMRAPDGVLFDIREPEGGNGSGKVSESGFAKTSRRLRPRTTPSGTARLGSRLTVRQPVPDDERLYLHFSERYGVGYESVTFKCDITPEGSASVFRTVEVAAHSEINDLDTFLLVPEPALPGEEGWEIGALSVRSLTPGWEVVLPKRPPDKSGTLSLDLKISPSLREGDELKYELVERLPRKLYAINLSEKELADRATPYDYFGWNINRPTRKLSLTAFFPEGTKPQVYSSEVRFASAAPGLPTQRRQHREEDRLDGPHLLEPVPGRYSLQLEIDYPTIGFIYIMRWEPLVGLLKPTK